jgi:hypothetical protein
MDPNQTSTLSKLYNGGSIIAGSSTQLGSASNPPQFAVENGLKMRMILEKQDLFMFTQRGSKISITVFVTNLISNIPSLISVFAIVLFAAELGVWKSLFRCCLRCGCCGKKGKEWLKGMDSILGNEDEVHYEAYDETSTKSTEITSNGYHMEPSK